MNRSRTELNTLSYYYILQWLNTKNIPHILWCQSVSLPPEIIYLISYFNKNQSPLETTSCLSWSRLKVHIHDIINIKLRPLPIHATELDPWRASSIILWHTSKYISNTSQKNRNAQVKWDDCFPKFVFPTHSPSFDKP